MTGGVHGGDRDSGLARPDRRPDTSPTTGECTAHIAATSAVPGSGSGTSVRHLRGARRWRGACAWQGRSGVRGCLGGCTGATVTRARPSQDPHPDTSPVHAPSHRQSALRLRTYSSESSHRGLSIVMHQPTKPCGGRRGAYHGGRTVTLCLVRRQFGIGSGGTAPTLRDRLSSTKQYRSRSGLSGGKRDGWRRCRWSWCAIDRHRRLDAIGCAGCAGCAGWSCSILGQLGASALGRDPVSAALTALSHRPASPSPPEPRHTNQVSVSIGMFGALWTCLDTRLGHTHTCSRGASNLRTQRRQPTSCQAGPHTRLRQPHNRASTMTPVCHA